LAFAKTAAFSTRAFASFWEAKAPDANTSPRTKHSANAITRTLFIDLPPREKFAVDVEERYTNETTQ
jgi:hypothetical protein